MAISLNSTLRNTRADAITTFAGNGAKLRLYTSGATQIVELVCGSPLAGAASSGVLTLNAITSGVAGATGTVTNASIYKSDGTTLVLSGLTVGTSGSNINLSSVAITSGDSVAISSATITEGNA
jgi:hypothetical protein